MIEWLLFFYTALCIGSVFVFVGWAKVLVEFGYDRPWRRSRPWQVSCALTVHAASMAGSTGYRAVDVLHGHANLGSEAGVLFIVLTGLLVSATQLVYAASLPKRGVEGRLSWTWPFFLLCLTLAGLVIYFGDY